LSAAKTGSLQAIEQFYKEVLKKRQGRSRSYRNKEHVVGGKELERSLPRLNEPADLLDLMNYLKYL
jgi:hypothetical protein